MVRRSAARTVSVVACLWGCAADLPPPSHAAPPRRAEPKLLGARPETGQEAAVAPTPAPPTPPDDTALADRYGARRALSVQRGQATYYGAAFAGHRTASGETFEPRAFTAAHRSLPFGTVVRVVCPKSRKFVYVRINDRGPFGDRRRIIDLSLAAAERLDIIRLGVADVRLEVVELGPRKRRSAGSRR